MKIPFMIITTMASLICCVEYNRKCYRQGLYIKDLGFYQFDKIIIDGVPDLRKLTIQENTTLFYTFKWEDDIRRTAFVTLDNNQNHIVDLNNTNTVAFDYNGHVVYIGADDGLYKLNIHGEPRPVYMKDSIKAISVGEDIMYVINSKSKLYVLRKTIKRQGTVFEDYDVQHMASNKEGIFIIITSDKRVGVLGRRFTMYNNLEASTIAVASNDVMYISTVDGLFKLDSEQNFKKINSHLMNLQGLEFLNDNDIVFAINGTVYKFKRISMPCD